MDRRLICAGAFLRSVAVGMTGVFLALHLAKLGFDEVEVGLVVSLGLAGGAVGMGLATWGADRFGRRRSIVFFELVAASGGAAFAMSGSFPVVIAAAFFGMVNGMGRDRGPSSVLDQAMLPGLAPDAERTRVISWYNTVVEVGRGAGQLLGALPFGLRQLGVADVESYRWSMGAYALLVVAGALVYPFLSAAVEAPPGARAPLTPESSRRVAKLSGLFFLDALGGGFIPSALIAYWFFKRFGLGEQAIAPLFLAARVANAVSYPIAAALAKRIGLVNTMVFTHLPGSLLLVAAALVPWMWAAIALFLLRELLVQMDVPTRQSYVMAVVRPEERTVASGMTNLVRALGWAVGALPGGWAMKHVALAAPLLAGSGLKIAYDVLLYFSFRRVVPPEETARGVQ